MVVVQRDANSKQRVTRKLQKEEFRHAYVSAHVRTGIAHQIRALRKERGWSQGQLADHSGKKQSNIARLENPDYGQLSVKTLLELATAFDTALIVRFAAFSDFLAQVEHLSPEDLAVPDFAHDSGLREPEATSPTLDISVWSMLRDQYADLPVSFSWPTSAIRFGQVINLSSTSDEEFERILVQERKTIALIPSAQIRVSGHA